MEFHQRLKKLRKESGYTQKEVASMMKITHAPYQRWESGANRPRADKLEELANIFDVSISYLLGESDVRSGTKINQIMEKLSEKGQEETIDFAHKKLNEETKKTKIIEFNNSLVGYPVLSDQALSAGKGNGISDDMSTYTVYWTKEVNSDYGVPIKGDSMEPDYHNKDIALIQEQPCPDHDGQVCAVLDFDRGVSYIKCVTVEDKVLRLESLNQSVDDQGNLLYEDILLPRDETTKILGKVIESFTPVKKKEI
ncbi:XRE family transcriptional regulator [Lactococcus petauri]|jgi:repressor LexA|uniref:Transcriptional regulator n=1 Tax=Lactococcus petauri TaxID=1940789 RepID=A0A252CAB3_9LACT|nr:XRE family transcriptional regulator [Lactococcus petauri]OUK02224.1 transcriptional regulator [Lactococcus petauri]